MALCLSRSLDSFPRLCPPQLPGELLPFGAAGYFTAPTPPTGYPFTAGWGKGTHIFEQGHLPKVMPQALQHISQYGVLLSAQGCVLYTMGAILRLGPSHILVLRLRSSSPRKPSPYFTIFIFTKTQ